MSLREFEHKYVRLIDTDGDGFEGYAGDYIFPEDNDPEIEGIVLDYPIRDDGFKYDNPVEFSAAEIRSIEIIERMNLRQYEGERVRITDTKGQTFEGYASDYIFPEDNYPQKVEGIILNKPERGDGYIYDRDVEFSVIGIRFIEIIK